MAMTIMLSKKIRTPRNALGRFPIGGDGSILFTESGAAMYVAEPSHKTRVTIAKMTERGFMLLA